MPVALAVFGALNLGTLWDRFLSPRTYFLGPQKLLVAGGLLYYLSYILIWKFQIIVDQFRNALCSERLISGSCWIGPDLDCDCTFPIGLRNVNQSEKWGCSSSLVWFGKIRESVSLCVKPFLSCRIDINWILSAIICLFWRRREFRFG